MAATVTTRKTELGDARVRLDVEVEPGTVEREIQSAARELGRDMRLSGFRKGKVPPPVVIQRVGRDAVLDEAVRRGLPGWYEQAVSAEGLVTVGDPKVDLEELPAKGSPLGFSVEVAVRPVATLGDYEGLEVGRRAPQVDEAEVAAEVDRLRESMASLETVDRPAGEGDFLVLDFEGRIDGEAFEGGEARGYLLELGSDRLVPGFEDQLSGARAGEERELRVTFPDDYRVEELAGNEATFQVAVKEVKEKRLPVTDDDLAAEAGYDSLDELRADIESRLRERDEQAVDREFREAVVDAAVERATVELPDELVHAKAHEMWAATAGRLRAQGIEPSQYLQMIGKSEEELVHEAEDDARTALGRESVLAAVVEDKQIAVTDDEVLDALRAAAAAQSPDRAPSEKQLRRSLDRARSEGRADMLREDIAMRKAVDELVESASPIAAEQAAARDKLWTPDKEEQAGDKRIWTPGS